MSVSEGQCKGQQKGELVNKKANNYFLMSILSENLKIFRTKTGLKQQEIADLVGVTDKNWSNWERDKSEPNIESLLKIANAFGISVDGLINRDASLIAKSLIEKMQGNESPNESLDESLKPKSRPYMLNEMAKVFAVRESEPESRMPKVVTVDTQGNDNVVFVPIRARAGYLSGYGDPDFIQTLPTYRLPNMSHGTFRMFEVFGQSMVPTFHESDVMITRFVENFNEIRDNRVYVVLTKREGVCVKRVVNRISRDGKLILNSDNQRHAGDYPPIVIGPEEVLEIWYVVSFMSRQMREPGEMYNRLIDVESRLTLLEHERKNLPA